MPGLRRTAVALVAITSIASAQPITGQPPPESHPASETPRIPITMRPGGEVLDDASAGRDAGLGRDTAAGRELIPPVPAIPPVSI